MDQSSFHFHEKKRVVVKIGSSSLNYEETGSLNFTKLEHLVRELCNLRNRGMDVCLVSSGAIAVGRQSLGMTERPRELSTKQACAAVGQARLMMIYQKLFAEYNQVAGQVLMTKIPWSTRFRGKMPRIHLMNCSVWVRSRSSMKMTRYLLMRCSLATMIRFLQSLLP